MSGTIFNDKDYAMKKDERVVLEKGILNPKLSGVLSNNRDGKLKEGENRRYVSEVAMNTTLGNLPDTSSKSILFEIGLRTTRWNDLLKKTSMESQMFSQTIRTSELISNEFVKFHSKNTNFVGVYDFMDLSAIGYLLAKSIGKFVNSGTLTTQEMRQGAPINIRALNTASEPITASDSAVLIPRSTSTIAAPGTWCALMTAANAYGSTVYTDNLQLDANYAPIISDYSNADLAIGCYHGLRVLMSMYDHVQAGSVMALAITKGFHCMNSVVGHTDEGGIMRDVLRNGDYRQPYGGISFDLIRNYTALPLPNVESLSQITVVCDTILLTTAAAVAVSDPCICIEGRYYPSVFSSSLEKKVDENEKDYYKRLAIDISNKVGGNSTKFAENYVRAISEIFGCTDVHREALNYLNNAFFSISGKELRHCGSKTVCPYFWIEPTSLLSVDGGVASSNGYGPICDVGKETVVDALPKVRITVSEGIRSMIAYEHRTARTVPLLLFLNNHLKDGLANWFPMNFDDAKMFLKGGQRAPDESRDKREDIANYLWGRGQSQLCAPAELGYIGKYLGCLITHSGIDDDFTIIKNHMLSSNELLDAKITMVASKPFRVNDGKLVDRPREIRRHRTSAIRALESARNRYDLYQLTGGEMFVPSNSEPVFIESNDDPNSSNVQGVELINKRVESTRKGSPIAVTIHDGPMKPSIKRGPVQVETTTTVKKVVPMDEVGDVPVTEGEDPGIGAGEVGSTIPAHSQQ